MTLQEFKTKARWSPDSGLDSASNYSGPDLSEYLKGPSRSRDSDVMADSNFAVALDMLGGESDTVSVERFGHWACGWFEVILVKSNDDVAVESLFEIYKALENYPVLDDSDFCERETEDFERYAEDAADELVAAVIEHLGLPESLSEDNDLRNFCIDMNMEHQRYYGGDSCINLYSAREPSESDIKHFMTCVREVIHSGRDLNPLLEFLQAAFDLTN